MTSLSLVTNLILQSLLSFEVFNYSKGHSLLIGRFKRPKCQLLTTSTSAALARSSGLISTVELL